MALRMELGIPPAYVLLRELMEEVRDLLFEQSSRQCETRPLFREPGLNGVKEDFMSSPPLSPQVLQMQGGQTKATPLFLTAQGVGRGLSSGTALMATSLRSG